MKKTIALVTIAILPLLSLAGPTSMKLSEALTRKLVKMDAVNTTGHYTGKSIKLTLTNNSNSSIEIMVDLGMILKPDNPAFQPLVLAGEEELTLKSHGTDDIDVEVFCDNAVKACPLAELHYSYLRICGEELYKVLQYVHGHSLFDHLGQAAVWSITNFHTLNSVYDKNRDSLSRKLISYISEVTKREKPMYYTTSTDNETPAQPSYIARIDKIYVPFELSLTTSKELTSVIYNSKSELVKTLFENRPYEAGKYSIMTDFDPAGLEAGKYSVRILEGEKVMHERTVTIGQ